MKFNIEVDIDWLNEEGSLDDEIKNQIINSITNKVEQNLDRKSTRLNSSHT